MVERLTTNTGEGSRLWLLHTVLAAVTLIWLLVWLQLWVRVFTRRQRVMSLAILVPWYLLVAFGITFSSR